MDALEFLLWLFGIVLIGMPFVLFGIPCIIAVIAMWLHRGRRSGEGDVEHGLEDRNRCLDCGHEWRDEG